MKLTFTFSFVIASLSLAALSGCAAPAGQQAPPTPAPATAVAGTTRLMEPPTATLPDGTVIRLELAITPEERAQGLMFRRSLATDRGMLFLFENSARWPFWMKDTWLPLDLIFLDSGGKVSQVFENVEPCSAEPCPQYIPVRDARAVLELAGGSGAAHGVREGVTLTFSRVPDYPLE